jgi:hypothetical protein
MLDFFQYPGGYMGDTLGCAYGTTSTEPDIMGIRVTCSYSKVTTNNLFFRI